jgi:hypothetical protein
VSGSTTERREGVWPRCLIAPLSLIVAAATAIVFARYPNGFVLVIGVLLYANAALVSYVIGLRRPHGTEEASPAAVSLAPQYRAWVEHAQRVCASLQSVAAGGSPEAVALVEPILQRVREMAARVEDLAVEAQRLYRYLLEVGPAPDPSGGATAQLRADARLGVTDVHERIAATAVSVLAAMDAVEAQAMRLAAGGVTGDDGLLAESVQKLDEMRAVADALEEVVARTQAQAVAM